MSSLERKLKRKNDKKTKKLAEKELAMKVALFGKLPNECLTCEKLFDKKNKEQVMAWSVVVKQEIVHLYCPECWNKAAKIIEEFKDHLNNKKDD